MQMASRKQFYNRFYGAPLIGKWMGRVGKVDAILSNSCAVTPEIWVHAAVYNAPLMIWSFLKPSPTDYLAERLGRKKRGGKFSAFATTSPIGKPPAGGAGWLAYRSFQFTRMVGWYFTLADATTGFAVNWTSTAYRWNGCVVPGGQWAQLHALDGAVELLPPIDFIFAHWIPDGHQFMGVGPTGIAVSNTQQASVGFSLSSRPNTFGFPDASWTANLVDGASGEIVAEGQNRRDDAGNQYSNGVYANGIAWNRAANKAKSGGNYRVEVSKNFGVIEWSGGSMSATSSPTSNAITPDP